MRMLGMALAVGGLLVGCGSGSVGGTTGGSSGATASSGGQGTAASSGSSSAGGSSTGSSAASATGTSSTAGAASTTRGTGTGSSAGSTTTTTTGGFPTAPHPPFPQIPNHGGGTVQAPALVTIGFPGDQSDALGAFGDWLVRSPWLSAVGADYGVGLGTHPANLVADLPFSGTVDDSDIRTFIAAQAFDGGLPLPTASTIYLLVFPAGVNLSSSTFGLSCQNFGGYHDQFSQGGQSFIYAVVPTCPAGDTGATSPTPLVVASHEFLEAATDPNPGASYYLSGGTWGVLGTEVGDLCQGLVYASDAGFTVQRTWSNALAAAGQGSPCAPVPPGEIAFNIAAKGPTGDDFAATISAQVQPQTVAFALTGWSTGPITFGLNLIQLKGPAITATIKTPNGKPAALTNGDVLTLTVTVPGGVASGSEIGMALETSADGFQTQNLAPLVIHVH